LIHFHRYRLYLFQHEPFFRAIQNQQASFVGYTHFGYPYPGEWARWGAERWDDLECINGDFWEWVSRTGFQFKTLRDFHLEEAGGGSVSGRLVDPQGVSVALEAGKRVGKTGQSPSGLDSGVASNGHAERGPMNTDSLFASLPDPLKSLGLEVQACQMRVQGKFFQRKRFVYWGDQIRLLDELLRGCPTVLSIGEGDGRLMVPLMMRHGFHLTVVDPYIEGYEVLLGDLRYNLRLFDVEDRCTIERVSFHEYNSQQSFDGVVGMGLTLDECWKGSLVDTPGCLSKAFGLTRGVMVVELKRPISNPGFQNLQSNRETFVSWVFKGPLPVGFPSLSVPTSVS
jgi:hypothetical protein